MGNCCIYQSLMAFHENSTETDEKVLTHITDKPFC